MFCSMSQVDLFLCTIAYLCLLAEHLDKPIIGYFGHPLLFMVPDVEETREDFWQSFVGMARSWVDTVDTSGLNLGDTHPTKNLLFCCENQQIPGFNPYKMSCFGGLNSKIDVRLN